MTHTEASRIVVAASNVLGWSVEKIADNLGVSADTPRSWEKPGGREREVHRRTASALVRLQRRVERVEAGR